MYKSEKFWDRAANTYDQEEKKDEKITLKIIENTKKYLNNGDVVLDYGCGTGTIDIALSGDVKEISAIDISSKMINLAKRKTEEQKIEKIYYTQTTIYDERLKKESFDVITAFTILHLVEDVANVIRRVNEILKPGGLFITVTPCIREKRLLNTVLSFVSKIGLIPNIRSFTFSELENSIATGHFCIIETERLRHSSPIYFIVAKKM